MHGSNQFLIFTLNEQRYALYLSVVERIVRTVEVIPLPKCPEIVMGIINVGGVIIPVVNIRKRFRLPEREMELSDHLVIARTPKRVVALVVDAVLGIMELPTQDTVSVEEVLPGTDHIQGIAKLQDGMVLIHDLNGFLGLEEEKALDAAMAHTDSALHELHNPERDVNN